MPARSMPSVLGESIVPDLSTPANGDVSAIPFNKPKSARTLPAKVVTVAFPASLAVLVLAFLLFQGRLDSRDPRLLMAPLDGDEQLGFS